MLDASGLWGYGSFLQSNGFISLGLLHFNAYLSPQELAPIVVAAVDTEALLLQLPKEKLIELRQELSNCILQKTITKRELQSLTGFLQFATKVIWPGRPFQRQPYAMQSIRSYTGHHIHLSSEARADIMWWYLFTEKSNDIFLLWDSHTLLPEFNTYSFASSSWSCEGCWGLCWFQFKWPEHLCSLPITTKELILVLVAVAIFGHRMVTWFNTQ